MKVFVHRYKWRHDTRRSKYLKLYKQGKVELIETSLEGWLYEDSNKERVRALRKSKK